ncbi:hypothetical protein A4A49_60623 [Nicotiana attenuata]|uniref:Uncharacterized protein n=1 Tax=Nicotiana attenuata TaxID=49451 RepID=A0A1J6HY34_NICAT|nr:hypothetical protein A4A49_60623 [Nicotiana attenuata]
MFTLDPGSLSMESSCTSLGKITIVDSLNGSLTQSRKLKSQRQRMRVAESRGKLKGQLLLSTIPMISFLPKLPFCSELCPNNLSTLSSNPHSQKQNP